MYPVWLLCSSNLRKKKVQNFFIALIILLSSVLLMTAVAVINNSEGLYLKMHSELDGAHQILKIENGLHDPYKIEQWWEKQQGVTVSKVMKYHNISGITHEGQDYSNVDVVMIDAPNHPSNVDRLLFDQGEETVEPSSGTVWIPTTLARSKGILLGDTIGFKTDEGSQEYKVSAIVVDISYSAPFTSTARIWMNPINFQQNLSSMQGEDKFMLGLRYDDYSQHQIYWRAFEKDLGSPYLESKTEYESLSSFYLITNKLIGFVMIFLALIMTAIALYTIYFTISDEIITLYKTIGILRSIGLTSGKIISVFVIQYTFLAVIAVIPGLFLSYLFSDIIMDSSVSSLKTGATDTNLLSIGFSSLMGVLLILVILGSAWIFSNKARKIEPAQAIRYGMSEKKSARKASLFGRMILSFEHLPTSLVIGLRGILKNIRGSSLMIIISAMTSAVLVFGFIFIFSIVSIGQTIPKWGYDSSDISMRIDDPSSLSFEELQTEFRADERVANFSRFGELNGIIPISEDSQDQEKTSLGIYLTVLDGDYNDTGVVNIEGRNPMNGDEVAIGVNVAKKLNKEIGDSVDIYIQGKSITLNITGIYQAIANMSNSARIKAEAVQRIQADYKDMDSFFINLRDGESPDLYLKELNQKYGIALWTATQQTLVDEVFSEAVTILVVPLAIMALLFIIVTFIIIYSVCRINIKKDSKTYGIYKTLGMTSKNIRISITSGIFVLSLIGGLVGLLVGIFALPQLLNMVLSDYGIVDIPLVMNWVGIILMVPISALAAGLGSWMASRLVQRTSPKILTME
jgi:putative ABC transport system permease protein